MSNLEIAVATYCAYLIGSLSSAILVCHFMRLPDPRTAGSHNPGATNVLRLGGKQAAFITLFGDMLKGVIPVLVARWYGFDMTALSFIAFAAFLGHLFPLFFRFEGGKGVATALGASLALCWPVGLCMMITWLLIAIAFRYASLASLMTALVAPLYTWSFTHHLIVTSMVAAMSVLLIYRHKQNMVKLYLKTESKIEC